MMPNYPYLHEFASCSLRRQGQAGKELNMKKKHGKKSRAWLIALLVVLLLFIAIAVAAAIFINGKLNLIDYSDGTETYEPSGEAEETDYDVDISGLERKDPSALPEGEASSSDDVLNILILGTDERTTEFSSARADAILIMSLNLEDHSAKLVSLERGMGVPILEGEYEGQYDWLTHCFRYGGASLMLKEVQTCFQVDVSHYVRLNFTSVKKIVDLLGGIDVDLSYAEAEYLSVGGGFNVSAGSNHLNGEAALAYARLRAIDSDWSRIKRQRTVIQACVNNIKQTDLLTLNELCDTILPYVQTNFTKREIVQLMAQAPNFLGVQFEQMTIPAEGTYGGMIGMQGRSLFSVDFETNAQILHDFLYGTDEK